MDSKMHEILSAAKENGVEVDDDTVELLQNPTKLESYAAIDNLMQDLTNERPIENIQRNMIKGTINEMFGACEEDDDRTLIDRNRSDIEEMAFDQINDIESDFNHGIVYSATEASTGIIPEAYARIYPWALTPDEYDEDDSDNDSVITDDEDEESMEDD